MRAWVVVLCLAASPAFGQVFKCTANGVTTYSETPCGDKPKVVEINVHHPSRQEQAIAHQRALADKREARWLDQQQHQQREQLAYERRIDEQRGAQKEAAFKAKCDGYERTAKNAGHEKDLYATQRYRDDADRRKREAEAQHFSECYGER